MLSYRDNKYHVYAGFGNLIKSLGIIENFSLPWCTLTHSTIVSRYPRLLSDEVMVISRISNQT